MKIRLPVFLLLTVMSFASPFAAAEEAQTPWSQAVDLWSYRLGVISAFAEMVNVKVKKLALSSPLSPLEADALIKAATDIAAQHRVQVYREPDLLVTDLFPASISEGKQVLILYQGDALNDYLELKQRSQKLVAAQRYSGQARYDIATELGRLLGYPDRVIRQLIRKNSNR